MKRALAVGLLVCLLGGLGWALQYVLTLRAAMAPTRPTTYVQAGWSVYRYGPGHAVHVDNENLDCTACHRSTAEGHFDQPGPDACVNCHEAQAAIEHAQVEIHEEGQPSEGGVAEELSACVRCHGFGPDPEQRPTDCQSCHAQAQGDKPAVELHAEEACVACHDVHDNRVTPVACQKCHTVRVDHAHRTNADASQCLDCHHVHAPASEALSSCRPCHELTGKAAIPANDAKHSCTGCHVPHAFGKGHVKACRSCHADQHVLAGKGHLECTSCHAPHAVSENVSTQNVCSTCHKNVALSHDSKVDPVAACTGCHEAHPKTAPAGPTPCTSCHAEVANNDVSAHAKGVECTGCHTPHAFAQTVPAAHTGLDTRSCLGCHGPRVKLLARHDGHARCESCHTALPHGGVRAPLECATCHKPQATAAHAGSTTGHTACLSCHDAHTGQRIKQCADCHAPEASHLSPKHGACASCHDSHSGSFRKGVADCSGCHDRAKLSGLHEVREHSARCVNCHDVHAATPAAAPERCLSCHQDHKNHQPSAKRCDGCHSFHPPPKKERLP